MTRRQSQVNAWAAPHPVTCVACGHGGSGAFMRVAEGWMCRWCVERLMPSIADAVGWA
jgi:hypothetical protein